MHNSNKCNHVFKFTTISTVVLSIFTILSALLLSTPHASASDSSSTINISLEVMAACSLSATAGSDLSTTINAGSNGVIGTTSLKAACNDMGGLAIYAIGYTGSTHGDTNLRREETGGTLSTTNLIPTGVSLSTSYWNMTVANNTSVPGNYTATIPAAFQSAHEVPTNQTQIASYSSTTDQTTGLNINVTYNAHAAIDQAAGTYKGKVKYTLVHPSLHAAPASRPATLDTGQTVNAKMKSLAAGSSKTYESEDYLIKSIDVHTNTTAPSGFTASDANTISSSTSEQPIYIVFDNNNDAGVMHLYTLGDKILLSPDSSYMFYYTNYLSDLSDLSGWDTSNATNMSSMFYETGGYSSSTFSLDVSGWDTSNVTNMSHMFYDVGNYTTTWSIGDLSNWDTSSVTDMSSMFAGAGVSATTWSIGDLSNWDTSNVTNMSWMFNYAGHETTAWSVGDISNWDTSSVTNMYYMFSGAGASATTFSLDLSGWDTSSVENMGNMFNSTGQSSTAFSINLSGWNTSNVTNMGSMFSGAGSSATATNWTIVIPQTNGNNINNTTNRLYGKTTSTYGTPPSGKSFTLAQ